jgi:hypothetical protein
MSGARGEAEKKRRARAMKQAERNGMGRFTYEDRRGRQEIYVLISPGQWVRERP